MAPDYYFLGVNAVMGWRPGIREWAMDAIKSWLRTKDISAVRAAIELRAPRCPSAGIASFSSGKMP